MIVPKSLKECYETDSVASRLESGAEWLKKIGITVLVLTILVGIILTITEIKDARISGDNSAVFITMITWFLYAFAEYFTYNVLALLVSSLAKIVQNTTVSAKVALYNASKEETVEKADSETVKKNKTTPPPREHSWICNRCGKLRSQSPCPYCGDD